MKIDCGIPQQRIITWLDDELSLAWSDGGWAFTHGDVSCRISIQPLPNRLIGKMDLEHALLTIEGDQSAIEEFNRLFTLRFMSAGG